MYIGLYYRTIKLMNDTIMNKTATVIVARNSVFSGPLRVLKPASTVSEPPKAPIPADRFCRSIPATRITESIICMMGKIVAIILNRINITLFKEKVKLMEFCTYLLIVLVDSCIIDS